PAAYRSCSVAILFAAIMVYQGSPLGATVIPNGPLPLTTLPSVMTPALVMPAALPLVSWVNQALPARLPPSALVLGICTGVSKLWVATLKRITVGSLEVM